MYINQCLLRFFLIPVVFFIAGIVRLQAQSPGGIATGNKLWLKSDNGISSTGNTVSQWQEISGAGITGNFTVQALPGSGNTQTGPTVIPAGINFNPYISFNGNTNSLTSNNSFLGTALVGNSNVTIFQVLTLNGGTVWLKWETDQLGTTARLGFENSGGRIRFDFPKANPASAGQNIGVTSVLNLPALSTAYVKTTTSVNRINGADDNTIPIPGPGDFTAATDKIVIGNERLINLPAMVNIAELIIYSNTLAATQRNKVESYLAVKYGFTLSPAAGSANNYTASNGTVTWNMVANNGYTNNITGIGRDDATSLSQLQSMSVNAAGLVTLYNGNYAGGNFPALNSANTNSFSNDFSFLIVGDNGGTTATNVCIFNNKALRMNRIWKASKTGQAGAVTIAVNQASVPASVKNMIVSADPLFPPGATTVYPLLSANGKLYTSVNLSSNDYFTFITDTLVVNIAITQPVCSNANSGNVTTTVTGGNAPYTFLWNPSGQSSANIINVAGGTYTLSITHGGCQVDTGITLIAPQVPVAPVPGGASVCLGFAATLAVQNPNPAFIYNWYDSLTGGILLATGTTFTTPAVTTGTTWYVEAVNSTCSSTRTAQLVIIDLVNAPLVNAATVCTGNTATLTIQNPNAAYSYKWYTTSAGGSIIHTGTSFTTPAISTTTSWYVEAVSSTCSSTRTIATVTVNAVIAHTANGVSVCTGTTATLTVQNPAIGYAYNWYIAASGGTTVGTGVSFTTPAVTSNTSWYLESVSNGCVSTRTAVPVTVNGINAPAANGISICTGTSALPTIQNPNIAYTYNWFATATGGTALGSGVSFNTVALTADTAFYVEAASATCKSVRTRVAVKVNTVASPQAVGVSVCANSAALLIIQNPNSNDTYNWFASATGGSSLNTSTNFTTPTIAAPVSYFAEATEGACTSIRKAVPVSITPGLNTPIISIGTVTTGSIVFNWQPVTGSTGYLVSVNGATPFINGSSTTYTVTGLATSETVNIEVIAAGTALTCGNSNAATAAATTYQSGFYMPTAFTPNAGSLNNTIKPSLPGSALLENFTVYNRWGQVVFATSKAGTAWDGKLKDKPQSVGVYVWICTYLNLGRVLTEKGSFLLLR